MEKPLVKNRKTSLLVLSAVFGIAFILFTGCRRPPDYSAWQQSKKQGRFKDETSQSTIQSEESSLNEESFSSSSAEIAPKVSSSQRIAEEGSWVRGYSTSDETVVENQSPQEGEQTTPTDALPPAENTVWITRKGGRYHSSSSCSNMKNPYVVTLEQAQASGRTPCRKCW